MATRTTAREKEKHIKNNNKGELDLSLLPIESGK
jgi:hypothetical protein